MRARVGKLKKYLTQTFFRYTLTLTFMRDVAVLAEHAFQGTACEKDSPRTALSRKAGLLPHMQGCARGCDHSGCCAYRARRIISRHTPIRAALARAKAASCIRVFHCLYRSKTKCIPLLYTIIILKSTPISELSEIQLKLLKTSVHTTLYFTKS